MKRLREINTFLMADKLGKIASYAEYTKIPFGHWARNQIEILNEWQKHMPEEPEPRLLFVRTFAATRREIIDYVIKGQHYLVADLVKKGMTLAEIAEYLMELDMDFRQAIRNHLLKVCEYKPKTIKQMEQEGTAFHLLTNKMRRSIGGERARTERMMNRLIKNKIELEKAKI